MSPSHIEKCSLLMEHMSVEGTRINRLGCREATRSTLVNSDWVVLVGCSRGWWLWFWGQDNCTEVIGVVALAVDYHVAIPEYFDIVLGEDSCAVIIAELSNLYEGAGFGAVEYVALLCMVGKVDQ